MHIRQFWGVLALFVCAVLTSVAHASSESWPHRGQLTYNVLRGEYGMKLGEAVHQWQHDSSSYQFDLSLQTTGLIGAVFHFEYTQSSAGKVVSGILQPQRFAMTQTRKRPGAALFDWDTQRVTIYRKGESQTRPISFGDQDVLSVWHMLSSLPTGHQPPAELMLVTQRSVTPSTIKRQGVETVTFMNKKIKATRWAIAAKSGKLSINLWVSEAIFDVPLRMVIRDRKGEVLDFQATGLIIDGQSWPLQ